jgi:hypothetical protein
VLKHRLAAVAEFRSLGVEFLVAHSKSKSRPPNARSLISAAPSCRQPGQQP